MGWTNILGYALAAINIVGGFCAIFYKLGVRRARVTGIQTSATSGILVLAMSLFPATIVLLGPPFVAVSLFYGQLPSVSRFHRHISHGSPPAWSSLGPVTGQDSPAILTSTSVGLLMSVGLVDVVAFAVSRRSLLFHKQSAGQAEPMNAPLARVSSCVPMLELVLLILLLYSRQTCISITQIQSSQQSCHRWTTKTRRLRRR